MPNKTELTHPLRLIKGLENTPQYKTQLTITSRKRALAKTAGYFSEKMEQKEEPTKQEILDKFGVRLIETIPSFVEGSRQLDIISTREEMMGGRVPRSEKLPHLEKVVHFNHVVRGLLDNFPDSTPENIVDFCMVAGAEMGGPKDAQYLEQEVKEVIVGMQHEIALEQILGNIEGVDEDIQGDVDDDLAGCDSIAIYKGMEIKLDAKASEQRCKNALADREYYRLSHRLNEVDMADHGYPVYTGVTMADFNGGFRINQTAIDRCAPKVEAVLSHLYQARIDLALQA